MILSKNLSMVEFTETLTFEFKFLGNVNSGKFLHSDIFI